MYQDYINGIFEFVGAFFTWKNAFVLYKDKMIKGVYWPTIAFFSLWGLWNLHYYPSLQQWASFSGGTLLVGGNITWVVLIFIYKKRNRN